ncbi:hypothetical protein VFPPC_16329 [Pochonia chlamydosporia 170]|uniref:Uncharacterized protein n=1 Tax=Pochonia chlamydosporia 170 TaxID=1380566 RepID=A0A179FJ53_METCM|nr:hypothetical protein VFPPC_16329 [Pochonia chlamydosporia 170]OAQ65291.1 hypothetical protein VFPPC_16329 [Pochonia chlamydosporia 170]
MGVVVQHMARRHASVVLSGQIWSKQKAAWGYGRRCEEGDNNSIDHDLFSWRISNGTGTGKVLPRYIGKPSCRLMTV